MVTKDLGWKMRSDVLLRDAENKLLAPLRNHGWSVEVERVESAGEYVVIVAERNDIRRRAALLYTSATDNGVFRRLDDEVDLTLFNGQQYMLGEFSHGVTRPVVSADDFHLHLVEWNRESAPGKILPVATALEPSSEPSVLQPRVRRLLSETPIDAIWSRLARLRSATLARKAVAHRAAAEGSYLLEAVAASKGDGVAYAIRSATDYFALKNVGNVSQRVLNLYYGCLSFAFAEMLAAPDGPSELSSIEDVTKQGHGLWTFGAVEDGFGGLTVGVAQSGFFPAWLKSLGGGPALAMEKKPRRMSDLTAAPPGSWATLEQLFSRLPEVGDLFEDIFPGPPAWVTAMGDQSSKRLSGLFGAGARAPTSYALLIDDSGRMTTDDIAALPGPIREITIVPSGTSARHFRVAVDHPGFDHFWSVLSVHRSPSEHAALIMPLFGSVNHYRAICVVILYALSIVVRYRPSLWRRIQEGDLDHLRALIEAFLAAVERILPEQFLESITKEKMSVAQPGSWLS
jgi:hypothetical protein